VEKATETIRLRSRTKRQLDQLGGKNDSYDKIIQRLLSEAVERREAS